MNELLRLPPRDLNNAECVHYNDRIAKRFTGLSLAPPVAAALAHFSAINDEMNGLVQLAKGSRFSDDVQDADAGRDRYSTSFFYLCEGFALCNDERRVVAAVLLLEALKPYGPASRLANANFDSQTKLTSNLVRDLRARPELLAALETLGLVSLLQAIEGANNRFIELQEARTDDETVKPAAYRMVALRRESAKAYTALMKQVESACNFTGGAEPYAGLVAGINAVTAEAKTKLAQRAGRAEEKPAQA
ncbi:DUF6261 family protein [Flaviaesturariibacter aridisoli]|uniref:Uncharacterized protein n=1 Tax=Flaviaesturariibacter aridisoli TaxID=2545761 RepID=A0A4R4EAP7_9BACT|nr:DUF6261 family protein [Flaviaesturariibacter aridisoli]TCZ74968.1 hypothetical protein E0486_01280 [Flaviaesturariibacter aridisoli]